ncbi:MAG: hypothetical protein Q9170_003409 [Blastenia crenularia]
MPKDEWTKAELDDNLDVAGFRHFEGCDINPVNKNWIKIFSIVDVPVSWSRAHELWLSDAISRHFVGRSGRLIRINTSLPNSPMSNAERCLNWTSWLREEPGRFLQQTPGGREVQVAMILVRLLRVASNA